MLRGKLIRQIKITDYFGAVTCGQINLIATIGFTRRLFNDAGQVIKKCDLRIIRNLYFISGLLHEAVSSPVGLVRLANNELKRMWKDAVMA